MITSRILLCGGLLLSMTPFAPADIVSVPINQTLTVGYTRLPYYPYSPVKGSVSYTLDINGDGVAELTFTEQSTTQVGFAAGYRTSVSAINGATIEGSPYPKGGGYYTWWATPFPSASAADPSATFSPTNTEAVLRSDNLWEPGGAGDASWASSDHYLAFRFLSNGQPHDAWVQLWVEPYYDGYSLARIHLYDAKYDTQVATIPEPACLSIYAAAVAPMLTRRRRT